MNLGDVDVDLSEVKSTERLALYILCNSDDPMTKAEVGHAAGISKGRTGQCLNRLKREGLIRPLENPTQPRSFLYEPTIGLEQSP